LRIFGERFDSSESPTVTIGGRPCLVLAFTAVEISCTLPGGTGTVDIVVTTGAESATFLAGYRYITGMPGLVALFRINAGGEAYRDSTGNVWEADAKNAYYARGAASRSDSAASTGTKGATTATISGTTDGALYQSYRVFPFGTSSPFLYVLPVPAADKYKVVLHFCEVDLFRTMPGSRVMDIYIEGKLFRQGFDIAAAAGGVFIAMTLSATEYVSDGAISIELKAVKHNPIIAAIEVFSVDKYP
jgi:Malectin domain/IPT/TIG domain